MSARQELSDVGVQLLPALTRDMSAAAREQPAGKHLPYARHVDDWTVETRDGLLMQFIQVRGLLFETADSDEINYRKRLRDAALQAIGSSRYAVYHHVIRREADVSLGADFGDAFSRQLDMAWRARLSNRKLYINDLFLTLVRRPLQGKVGTLDRLKQKIGRTVAPLDASRYELQQLAQARDALIAALGSYEPRLLGVYDSPQGPCSEALEFLSYLFNGEMRPALLPMQDLGDYLPYRRVSFGQDAVELGRAGASPRQFLGLVSIKDYPGQTAPGMLDELLRLPFELTISQSFGFVERQAALSRMNLALRRMKSAEDDALSLRAELTDAKDDVAAGRAAFGEHHMTIAVRADAMEEVEQGTAEIQAALADPARLSTSSPLRASMRLAQTRSRATSRTPPRMLGARSRTLPTTARMAGCCPKRSLRQPRGRPVHKPDMAIRAIRRTSRMLRDRSSRPVCRLGC